MEQIEQMVKRLSYLDKIQLQRIFNDLEGFGWEVQNLKYQITCTNPMMDNYVYLNKKKKSVQIYADLSKEECKLFISIMKIYGWYD